MYLNFGMYRKISQCLKVTLKSTDRSNRKILLELERSFMFVGTQQRITLNNTHYYVDMVFYNKILRAYVLIELKTTKLTPDAAGQLNCIT